MPIVPIKGKFENMTYRAFVIFAMCLAPWAIWEFPIPSNISAQQAIIARVAVSAAMTGVIEAIIAGVAGYFR